MGGWGISMKNKRTITTVFLAVMMVLLLSSTIYISGLLSSPNSPTQIKKTKAAPVTYTRNVDLFPTEMAEPTPLITQPAPTLLALAPTTVVPTTLPTTIPTTMPSTIPTKAPVVPTVLEPTAVPPSPTLQPLLAYKSTSISPTLAPLTKGGSDTIIDPTKVPSPTKKIQPTGTQELPETGWIQTSSILFIVATSTILFSLLY